MKVVENNHHLTQYIQLLVAVEGKYAYVAALSRILIVDISDPHKPTKVGSYRMEQVEDVAIAKGYLYATDLEAGLVIFKMSL